MAVPDTGTAMGRADRWRPAVVSGRVDDATIDDANEPHPSFVKPQRMNWWGSADDVRWGRVPFDARRVMHWVSSIAVALVVLSTLASVAITTIGSIQGPAEADLGAQLEALPPAALVMSLVYQFLLFAGPPLLWVAFFYRAGRRAWASRLRLVSHHLRSEMGWGVLFGVLGVVFTLASMFALSRFVPLAENPIAAWMGSMSWPIIIMIALVSSTSEELFFRGFIQARFGIVFTNVLFGAVHMGYGIASQVVVPMLLGFAMSWLVVRTRSLLPAIFAHFLYNGIQLALVKLWG